ncbi:unnamed protein product, partial [Didymodactylos carnosus]
FQLIKCNYSSTKMTDQSSDILYDFVVQFDQELDISVELNTPVIPIINPLSLDMPQSSTVIPLGQEPDLVDAFWDELLSKEKEDAVQSQSPLDDASAREFFPDRTSMMTRALLVDEEPLNSGDTQIIVHQTEQAVCSTDSGDVVLPETFSISMKNEPNAEVHARYMSDMTSSARYLLGRKTNGGKHKAYPSTTHPYQLKSNDSNVFLANGSLYYPIEPVDMQRGYKSYQKLILIRNKQDKLSEKLGVYSANEIVFSEEVVYQGRPVKNIVIDMNLQVSRLAFDIVLKTADGTLIPTGVMCISNEIIEGKELRYLRKRLHVLNLILLVPPKSAKTKRSNGAVIVSDGDDGAVCPNCDSFVSLSSSSGSNKRLRTQ